MKTQTVIAVISLVLAGCGGGQEKVEPVRGVLHTGKIQGVGFRTPTQAGATDANGEFSYLPGETVTFHIGSVEIGSAPGTADINLFTLAGLTPPSTEYSLRRELDLARRTHTPFTRAANIDRLLIGLDADGNPDNGLDVRGKAALLEGAGIDFDLGIFEFDDLLYRRVPDLVRGFPPWWSVVNLYRSLGLAVPVHAQTRIDYESNSGLPAVVNALRYHRDGSIAADELDLTGDDVADQRYLYQTDAQGRLTSLTGRRDTNLDGTEDDVYSTRTTFDSRGDRVSQEQLYDFDGDGGWDERYANAPTLDRFGRTISGMQIRDTGNDGSVDGRDTYTASWNAHGYPIEQVWSSDADADGVIDDRSITRWQWDAADRPLTRIQELDDDANGVVDARYTDTYEYGGPGPATAQTSEADYDMDGIADSRAIYRWTYDRAGNQLTRSYEEDFFADGDIDQRSSAVATYDAGRRELTSVRSDDLDGNGAVETVESQSVVFDSIGNRQSMGSEYDANADGVIDARFSEVSEYGAGGELLATGFGGDQDGDGFPDTRTTIRVTNEVLADGVLHLAQWYFMRN